MNRVMLTARDLEKIREWNEKGCSDKEIAAVMCKKLVTVRAARLRMGLPMHYTNFNKKLTIANITESMKENETVKEVEIIPTTIHAPSQVPKVVTIDGALLQCAGFYVNDTIRNAVENAIHTSGALVAKIESNGVCELYYL